MATETAETIPVNGSQAQFEQRLDAAAHAVHQRIGDSDRPIAIVSGSGLSALASIASIDHQLDASEIPHYPKPSVYGHSSTILVGAIRGVGCIFFAGRVHLYEGRPVEDVVFAAHLAKRLGVERLLVTNAAGGVGAHLQPGDLMAITDHVNLTGHALPGAFRRQSEHYDPRLRERLKEAAALEKMNLKEGIYACNLGPTYETRAEAELLRIIGADAVGMSTVLDVAAACRLGLKVAAVSCIANHVPAWGRTSLVTHEEVIGRMREALDKLKRLIPRWVELTASHADR